jgi:DDE family transposase
MPKANYKTERAVLQAFLETYAEELGRETGFVRRESKLNSALFVQTMVLSCVANPEASLNEMVEWSDELGLALTAQGLDKRLNEGAVSLLWRLVERGVARLRREASVPEALLAQFKEIAIVDSTQVALPAYLSSPFAGSGGNASAASVKFQLRFDYLSGQVSALAVEAGRHSDHQCQWHRQPLKSGSLQLFDLGYFKQAALTDITQADAYFICRLHPQVGLYETVKTATGINLAQRLKQVVGDRLEFTSYIGNQSRLPVRVLAQRLPAVVVAQRHRKAQATARRKNKCYSQNYLTLLDWSILITNVPQARLAFEHVMALYPIRWQIELLFKLWKSHAKLASVGQWRPQRVLCHLYARLLALVLFHWLIAPWRFGTWGELSLTKAFQVFQHHTFRLAQAIGAGWRGLSRVLDKLIRDCLRFARKDKRRQSPSSFYVFVHAGA